MKKIILIATFLMSFSYVSIAQVGIGTETPTATLDVDGTLRVRNLPAANSTDLPINTDVDGNVSRGYRPGEVIAITTVTNFTTQVLNSGDLVRINTTYQKKSSNSKLLVTYDCSYFLPGSNSDVWNSTLFIANVGVTDKQQVWDLGNGDGTGTRGSTILPITGVRTLVGTSTIPLRVDLFDTVGDDELQITPNDGIMTIIEIQN